MEDIRNSIVGIVAKHSSTYRFAGAGFVVEGGLILTCAHVLNAAQKNNNTVQFRIEKRDHFIDAKIILNDPELDIGILQPDNLPSDVPGLILNYSNRSAGHVFSVFGYPQQGGFSGLHGAGKILGSVEDNLKREALQLSSTQVTHGYSGGPVWDDDDHGVVGMVQKGIGIRLDKKLGDVAFAIPCEILQRSHPKLKLHEGISYNSKIPEGDLDVIVKAILEWKIIHTDSQNFIAGLDIVLTSFRRWLNSPQIEYQEDAGLTWQSDCLRSIRAIHSNWNFSFVKENEIDRLITNIELTKAEQLARQIMSEEDADKLKSIYYWVFELRSDVWNVLGMADDKITILTKEL